MKYIAVDPSFTKTGIAALDTETKEILLKPITPEGKNATYKDTIERSALVTTGILEEIRVWDKVLILFEEPMVSSLKASSLGALSGVLATTLLLLPNIIEVYTVNPVTITRLNSALPYKKQLNKKQLSQKVAEGLIELFKELNYNIILKTLKYNKDGLPRVRKMSHDEAEALILLTVFLLNIGFFSEEEKLELYKINKGFYTKDIKINKLK